VAEKGAGEEQSSPSPGPHPANARSPGQGHLCPCDRRRDSSPVNPSGSSCSLPFAFKGQFGALGGGGGFP